MKKYTFFRALLVLWYTMAFHNVYCQTATHKLQVSEFEVKPTSPNTSSDYLVYSEFNQSGFAYNVNKISKHIDFESSKPNKALLVIDLMDAKNEAIKNFSNKSNEPYLIWGHNGGELNKPVKTISVNLSAGISPTITTNVSFTTTQRVWKVVENSNINKSSPVTVKIPQNALKDITTTNDYYLFISDNGIFDASSDYRLMISDKKGYLTTEYDFDTTKFITIGYSQRVDAERSIYFDGIDDYVDMDNRLNLNPSAFTISAWIKRDTGLTNASIVSKRDASFTNGYDFKINDLGKLQMVWRQSTEQSLTSITTIPENKWHHVTATYNGIKLALYIDGILDSSTNLTAPLDTAEPFYIGAGGRYAPNAFFKGGIDEVRLWNIELSVNQLRFIMNQEIEEHNSFVNGQILPFNLTKNEVASIPWDRLDAYYPMTEYTYTNIIDASGNGNIGALRNINTVDVQTAPLPYKSNNNGNWVSENTWLNGSMQPSPNNVSIVDGVTPIDWNIVETNHNISIDTDNTLGRQPKVLGLMVLSNKLTVEGNSVDSQTGNGLTVTHYLKLNGTLDLNGESQLIQTFGSDFDVNSSGSLERDQQGTADNFTYNYWSSPVGVRNTTTNNNSFKIRDVMKDGTSNINWLTSGYNGTNTNPVGIADYWIWKYANLPDNSYPSWQHVRSTSNIKAGEGFTMKGPGTGSVLSSKNYTFVGKPNNGDINIVLSANNDYLVGNPYPSAIDGRQFILDNAPIFGGNGNTTGTLYFWQHWGSGTHSSTQFLGGYAVYNLSGGTPCASLGTNNPNIGTGGIPTKIPRRYIPVGQGFFIIAEGNGGTIKFKNSQRVFVKEGTPNSVFVRNSENNTSSVNYNPDGEDARMKFRIGFSSANGIHRQLLLTIDENATENIDWGYDAFYHENQMDDMYWMVDAQKFVIQGRDAVNETSLLPLGLHLRDGGQNKISIDFLENVPSNIEIFVHDKVLDSYHNLRQGDYTFNLPSGTYLDRFEITFQERSALSIDENELTELQIYFANKSESLVLINPTLLEVNGIELFNVLGQKIQTIKPLDTSYTSEYSIKNLSTGTYIVKVITNNLSLSKQVLVK